MTNTAQFDDLVLGNLFGWPVHESALYPLFFGGRQRPITDSRSTTAYSSTLSSGSTIGLGFLPVVGEPMGRARVDRITDYLQKSALKAQTIDDKEAYELASAIVLRAFAADTTYDIYRVAFAYKYGSTPERAMVKIEQRRMWMLNTSTSSPALPPKKPVQSVSALPQFKKESK